MSLEIIRGFNSLINKVVLSNKSKIGNLLMRLTNPLGISTLISMSLGR